MKKYLLILVMFIAISATAQYKIEFKGATEQQVKEVLIARGYPIATEEKGVITTFSIFQQATKNNAYDLRLTATPTESGYVVTGEIGWHNRRWITIDDSHVFKNSRMVMDEFGEYFNKKSANLVLVKQ